MTTALERLQGGYYNSGSVSGGNPGGLGDGGHVVNFPAAANDMGAVGAAAAAAATSGAASAATATTQAALATTKAEIATDKAEDAEVAAYEADGSRTEAEVAAAAAEGFKTTAQAAATTATEKAVICTDKAAIVEALAGPAAVALAALYDLVEALGEDPDMVTTLLASMAAKADLVDGKLREDQLPSLALNDVNEVANQAAMLALTAQPGDIAVRSDENKTYMLAAAPATTLANWKWLKSPTDVVLSVAGQTGAISAGALKAALAMAIGDVAGLQDALDAKADKLDAVVTISTATHTFQAADLGKVHRFTYNGAKIATVPPDLIDRWNGVWRHIGTGSLTFAAAAGATLENRAGHTKSGGQKAEGTLAVDSNVGGNAAVAYLGGDTAA